MKKFRLSPECVLEDGSDAVVKALMKGSFVIACDFSHRELILQNVFHYSAKRRSIEYYSLFYDEKTERRNLRLEWAIIAQNPNDVYSVINENVFGNYSVYSDEFPSEYNLGEVPEKYRNDFRMVWKAAHDELKALADEEDKKSMEDAKRLDELLQNATMLIPKDEDKPILKKFYRVLANTYHPDNKETGDTNMMKYVNNLKVLWGLS